MKHIHPQAVLLFELLRKAFRPQITVSVKGPPPPTVVQACTRCKTRQFLAPSLNRLLLGQGHRRGHEALPSHLQ